MTAQVEMTAEKTTTVMTAAPASISLVILVMIGFLGTVSLSLLADYSWTSWWRVPSLISLLHN